MGGNQAMAPGPTLARPTSLLNIFRGQAVLPVREGGHRFVTPASAPNRDTGPASSNSSDSGRRTPGLLALHATRPDHPPDPSQPANSVARTKRTTPPAASSVKAAAQAGSVPPGGWERRLPLRWRRSAGATIGPTVYDFPQQSQLPTTTPLVRSTLDSAPQSSHACETNCTTSTLCKQRGHRT